MGIDGTKKQATSILPHTQISTTWRSPVRQNTYTMSHTMSLTHSHTGSKELDIMKHGTLAC